MTATPTALPTVVNLVSFMRSVGWTEHVPGVLGTLWTKDDFEIGLPRSMDRSPRQMRDVLLRLAEAERLDVEAIARRARFFRIDVTQFEASDAESLPDGVPLPTAEKLVTSVRGMLRCAGTTATRARSEIRGNFSTQGDLVTNRSLMGYTERGSYIVPILVPLPEAVDTPNEDMLEGTQDLPEEPFERRVVRTLAQAMDAVNRLVVQPDTEPNTDTLVELVERGVSSELCRHLEIVLGEDFVAQFGTKFEWAGAYRAPKNLPGGVMVAADARGLIGRTADRLKQERIEPTQVYSGPIIALQHEPNEGSGWITVSTVRHGRACKIRVQLPYADYRNAVRWHHDSRPVIIEGEVNGDRSRSLYIEAPVRCRPVDEDQLPIDPPLLAADRITEVTQIRTVTQRVLPPGEND